jgi:hypothetical protein
MKEVVSLVLVLYRGGKPNCGKAERQTFVKKNKKNQEYSGDQQDRERQLNHVLNLRTSKRNK